MGETHTWAQGADPKKIDRELGGGEPWPGLAQAGWNIEASVRNSALIGLIILTCLTYFIVV